MTLQPRIMSLTGAISRKKMIRKGFVWSGTSLDKCPNFGEAVVQKFPEVKVVAASFV